MHVSAALTDRNRLDLQVSLLGITTSDTQMSSQPEMAVHTNTCQLCQKHVIDLSQPCAVCDHVASDKRIDHLQHWKDLSPEFSVPSYAQGACFLCHVNFS